MTTPADVMEAQARPTGHEEVEIRPAALDDVDAMAALIASSVGVGQLRPRSRNELVRQTSDFLIAATPAQIIGCAELLPLRPGLAEVRSLVVRHDHRGRGVAARLLARLIDISPSLGYSHVCAFTRDPRPFIHRGFSMVPHHWVPEKLAADCWGCEWFRRCAKCALILDLNNLDRRRRRQGERP